MYKVLIADDEPWVIYGLQRLISWEEHGFTVCGTASNGDEAFEKCLSLKPDVLISDIRMPGLSGIDLLESLRESAADIEVVFVSGYSAFEYTQKAVRLGAADYLIKQVTAKQLSEACQRLKTKLDSKGIQSTKQFNQILQFVDENYTDNLRISDLAKEFHFTPNYFSTVFKKIAGVHFTKYITDKRIELAKSLLSNDSLSLQEIVERVGYKDYFQFIKIFKRETGISPGQYRKGTTNAKTED